MPTRLSARDLSLELLRGGYPNRYRSWVMAAVAAMLGGYTASALVHYLGDGWVELWRGSDPYIALAGWLSLAALLAGKERVAAMLVLAGVWSDVHVSIVVEPELQTVAGFLIPTLVVGAGLLLGSRAALIMAGALAASVPLAVWVSQHVGHPVAADALRTRLFIVATEGTVFATAGMLVAFLRTFEVVLRDSLANELRARELVESAPDAVIVLSRDGRIEAFNKAAERLLGVSREAVLGEPHRTLPLRDLDGAWGGDPAQLAHAGGPLSLRVGDGPTELEALVRTTGQADGTEALMVVLRDVTQRKQAEARATELQEQLQHAQKLEAVGRLAGGVAHDFNNLLTAIGGFGSLVAVSADPKARGYGQEIVAAQKRGAALVRQLLAFARKDVVQPRPMDVAVVITEMSVLLERLVTDQVRIAIDARGPCPIMADAGRFEQVVLNLAANASDAMPDGGTLSITCDADDKTVTLTVSDTGAGIDPAMRSRIFEPFFTTKARSKGTGLGLATVHGIVTDSGGTIEVDSEPGKGARFTVRWPRSFLLADRQGSSQSFRAVTGKGLSVLLVEDDEQARTYVTQLLKDHGYAVHAACNAEEALQHAQARPAAPDLLLSDVVMPGLSGPQLARKLGERWPGLRTLYMSGYIGDLGEREGIDPVADLVTKPFSGRDLLERMDRKLT